jgi:hypothetical protein
LNADLARAAERLRAASRVTVVTGAGVSAASGVPTFCGADGLWSNFRVEELATPGRDAGERSPSGSPRFDLAVQGPAEELLDGLEAELSSGSRLSSSQ